jgi:hypothetical protein
MYGDRIITDTEEGKMVFGIGLEEVIGGIVIISIILLVVKMFGKKTVTGLYKDGLETADELKKIKAEHDKAIKG